MIIHAEKKRLYIYHDRNACLGSGGRQVEIKSVSKKDLPRKLVMENDCNASPKLRKATVGDCLTLILNREAKHTSWADPSWREGTPRCQRAWPRLGSQEEQATEEVLPWDPEEATPSSLPQQGFPMIQSSSSLTPPGGSLSTVYLMLYDTCHVIQQYCYPLLHQICPEDKGYLILYIPRIQHSH